MPAQHLDRKTGAALVKYALQSHVGGVGSLVFLRRILDYMIEKGGWAGADGTLVLMTAACFPLNKAPRASSAFTGLASS